jgi:UDP-N-acetylmuramyl pentapeptide phosphotransferase/UDP-N-acetylglucosamine-1-phosphate transferase
MPMFLILLVALVVAFGVSLIAAALALIIFPWFRSGERKPGVFRPDQSSGSIRAVMLTGQRRKRVQPRSSELPLVGGAAIIVAIVATAVGTGVWLAFTSDQWLLLGLFLASLVGFGIIGFLDDWHKVYHGQGISERAKLAGVVLVSLLAAIALNRLIPSARFAYSPYADIPVLGQLLRHTHFTWVIFFVLMTVTVSSTTSLAVDFTDGLDGLAGGSLVSLALAFAIILLSEQGTQDWPAIVVLIAMVGALLGYLPLNWPSSFKRGEGRGNRRAKLIMGDTGSLALGGAVALITVMTRNELLLIVVAGIFLLEGLSALVSARILVKFFRRFLYLPRYGDQWYPHTEFPLPFLATPMHHHFDLLGWERQRLVYSVWTLGAALGALGVASTIAPFTWERYLARLLALIVLIAVWQMGPWSRYYFIGLQSEGLLALYYGFPYRLFGRPLYARVDTVAVGMTALQTPVERLGLWQRTNVYDARASLGYLCYRAGSLEDAVRVWSKIPNKNLEVRPQIRELLAEARHQRALEADGFLDAEPLPLVRTPADTQPATPDGRGDEPARFADPPVAPDQFAPAIPFAAAEPPPRQQPTSERPPMVPLQEVVESPQPFTPTPADPTPAAEVSPPDDSTSIWDSPTWAYGARHDDGREEPIERELPGPGEPRDQREPSEPMPVAPVAPEPPRALSWFPPDEEPQTLPPDGSWAARAPVGLRTPRLEPVTPATSAGPHDAQVPPAWNGAGTNTEHTVDGDEHGGTFRRSWPPVR